MMMISLIKTPSQMDGATWIHNDEKQLLTISKPCQLPFTLLFTDHSHKTLMMYSFIDDEKMNTSK